MAAVTLGDRRVALHQHTARIQPLDLPSVHALPKLAVAHLIWQRVELAVSADDEAEGLVLHQPRMGPGIH